MSRSAVVRNYAETLLELAVRDDDLETYSRLLSEVATFYRNERDFRRLLETPRITMDEKKEAIRQAFADRAPEPFLRFLLVVLEKGRQRFLPRIEEAFREMMDEREGRVQATVTLAREPEEPFREEVREKLAEAVGREVVPHFRVEEDLLGGIVVRVGDRVMDGSIRRRLVDLRRRLLTTEEASATRGSGGAAS